MINAVKSKRLAVVPHTKIHKYKQKQQPQRLRLLQEI